MTDTTSSTITDGIIVGHGLMCVASHLITHQLPAPVGLELNTERLTVDLVSDDVTPWVSSLVDVTPPVLRGTTHGRIEHHQVDGLLPDTGVRVRLAWIQLTPEVPA